MDHATARRRFAHVLAGVPVETADLEEAVAHAETCESCARDLGAVASRAPATAPDPPAIFERALAAALGRPDPVVRRRAAEQLGEAARLGPATLGALAQAAGSDADRRVREAALRALDALDAHVSIPDRLIEAWSAEPTEAAAFIEAALDRLAEPRLTRTGVDRLDGTASVGEPRVSLRGEGPIHGEVVGEGGELRLDLEGLPARLERTVPVVAVPEALLVGAPSIPWTGDRPGLVPAADPVAGGSLHVVLARGAESPPGDLFRHVYLLNPRGPGG